LSDSILSIKIFSKFFLALVLCAIVLPAWRKFVLPTYMEFLKAEEEEKVEVEGVADMADR